MNSLNFVASSKNPEIIVMKEDPNTPQDSPDFVKYRNESK